MIGIEFVFSLWNEKPSFVFYFIFHIWQHFI